MHSLNTLRPRQNGRHFADDTFKRIFMNENVGISILISLKFEFVPKCLINNIPALVQIMAWRRPGDKPLSEPMMVNLLMYICVTRPQWVKETISIKLVGWLILLPKKSSSLALHLRVAMMSNLSALKALEVVVLTASGATSDEKVIVVISLEFLWLTLSITRFYELTTNRSL